ncbi:MAG: M56 family metallopeptidase [Clostridia bacterium]
MTSIFISVLNMSVTASYVVLAVMLARILLRKAPKVFSYGLWSLVLFRLVVPFSFSSRFSLFGLLQRPDNFISQNIGLMPKPTVDLGIKSISTVINNSLPAATGVASVNPLQVMLYLGAIVWLFGIGILLILGLIAYFRTKSRVQGATLIAENIYSSEQLVTPFVLGFIHPKIYLPSNILSAELAYVVEHEKAHIRRSDHLMKPLAYLALVLHWFNPLIWLSFWLMTKDMEMSCDERVLKSSEQDIRKIYSKLLLSLSTKQSGILNPLAFGESNVKSRIKNILNYKKPAFWVSLVILLILLVVAVPLISNNVKPLNGNSYLNTENVVPMKGLEIYVWKNKELTGNNDTYYTLQVGTNRIKELSEIYDTKLATNSLDKLNEMLAGFGSATEVFIYQMNTEDFTKAEMQAIADKIKLTQNTYSIAIGLWQGTTTGTDSDTIKSIVEANIAEIMSSPKASSNPKDYIDAHQNAYENIVKQGEEALTYLLQQFAAGDNNNLRGQLMMRLAQDLLGTRNNVSDTTLAPQEWFKALVISRETKLPDFQYGGINPIEKLVYATELAQVANPKQEGFIIVAPKIFASYEEENQLKVFVTTFSTTYRLYGKVLSEVGGSVVPAAITYTKDATGAYVLDSYQPASDGSEFAPSIKEFCRLPVSGKKIAGLADKILQHYGNYEDIIQLERLNLQQHLRANQQVGIMLALPSGETVPLT